MSLVSVASPGDGVMRAQAKKEWGVQGFGKSVNGGKKNEGEGGGL